ncbi:hypothetical protein VZG47_06645 [Synechococcus elongatus IITB5]
MSEEQKKSFQSRLGRSDRPTVLSEREPSGALPDADLPICTLPWPEVEPPAL